MSERVDSPDRVEGTDDLPGERQLDVLDLMPERLQQYADVFPGINTCWIRHRAVNRRGVTANAQSARRPPGISKERISGREGLRPVRVTGHRPGHRIEHRGRIPNFPRQR